GHVAGHGVAEVELGLQEGEGIVGVRHRPGCGLGPRGRAPLHARPRHAAGQDGLDVLRHRPAVRIAIGRVLGRRPRGAAIGARGWLYSRGRAMQRLPGFGQQPREGVARTAGRDAGEESWASVKTRRSNPPRAWGATGNGSRLARAAMARPRTVSTASDTT